MNRVSDSANEQSPNFNSTRWSLVLRAGRASSVESRLAMESLCRVYWYPLYAYVRRRGYRVDDARDLTQEFFARLLEKELVEAADPSRGKFRSFLLTSLRNFLTNEWQQRTAQKRGGPRGLLSLDFGEGDSRYAAEPASRLTPEQLYLQQWAATLLDRVTQMLRKEYVDANKQQQFDVLKSFLAGRNSTTTYAAAAQSLGVGEAAAMQAASRMRKRYRDLLRAEVAGTLSDPEAVDEELRELREILSWS